MIVTEYADLGKVARLQKYAKTFAPTLRFHYVDFYENFIKPYSISYEIDVIEYNALCNLEMKLEERLEKKKSSWFGRFKKFIEGVTL